MRLDMPILNDDFVGSDQEGDDVIRQGDDTQPWVNIAHYENMPMQYIEFSEAVKIFSRNFFIFFPQNTDCGYTLELPCRGGSNEYPQ